MGKQPVVADRDAQTGRDEEGKEKGNLKPIKSITPDEDGHGGEGDQQRADQEQAVGPVHQVPTKKGHRKISKIRTAMGHLMNQTSYRSQGTTCLGILSPLRGGRGPDDRASLIRSGD